MSSTREINLCGPSGEGHSGLSRCKLRSAARLPVRQKRRPGHIGRASRGYAKPVNAKRSIALAGSLIGRVAHHFNFDAERQATDYFVSYPIDGTGWRSGRHCRAGEVARLTSKNTRLQYSILSHRPSERSRPHQQAGMARGRAKAAGGRSPAGAPNSGAWATVDGTPVYVANACSMSRDGSFWSYRPWKEFSPVVCSA